jgi:hypothetical protein
MGLRPKIAKPKNRIGAMGLGPKIAEPKNRIGAMGQVAQYSKIGGFLCV